jgi:hypothetical protein
MHLLVSFKANMRDKPAEELAESPSSANMSMVNITSVPKCFITTVEFGRCDQSLCGTVQQRQRD